MLHAHLLCIHCSINITKAIKVFQQSIELFHVNAIARASILQCPGVSRPSHNATAGYALMPSRDLLKLHVKHCYDDHDSVPIQSSGVRKRAPARRRQMWWHAARTCSYSSSALGKGATTSTAVSRSGTNVLCTGMLAQLRLSVRCLGAG